MGYFILFFGIAVIAFFFRYLKYRFKLGKAKKLINTAKEAAVRDDDKEAISFFKQSLSYANEKPEMEVMILSYLDDIYKKLKIKYDFEDYNKLIAQTETLLKKSYDKSSKGKGIKETKEVIKLKKELLKQMPEL